MYSRSFTSRMNLFANFLKGCRTSLLVIVFMECFLCWCRIHNSCRLDSNCIRSCSQYGSTNLPRPNKNWSVPLERMFTIEHRSSCKGLFCTGKRIEDAICRAIQIHSLQFSELNTLGKKIWRINFILQILMRHVSIRIPLRLWWRISCHSVGGWDNALEPSMHGCSWRFFSTSSSLDTGTLRRVLFRKWFAETV